MKKYVAEFEYDYSTEGDINLAIVEAENAAHVEGRLMAQEKYGALRIIRIYGEI